MDEVEYTEEQKQAISTLGSSLLVSAAAGSGKTTIMIERVKSLISEKNIPIKNFLIISFTKASASDMKNKLIRKLSSVPPTPFILEQLDDILTSDVSNLHSFCARLLKSYFYEVGLDPTFVVLDEDEANVLKQKALDKIIKQKSLSKDKKFFELVDIFSKHRSVDNLKESILKVYEFLCSIAEKDAWKEMTLKSLYEKDFDKNIAAQILNDHAKAERKRLEEKLEKYMEIALNVGEKKLITYVQFIDSYIKNINFKSSFIENAKRLSSIPSLMRVPKAPDGLEEIYGSANAFAKEVKERFDKLKEYFNVDYLFVMQDALALTGERVGALFDLTEEFSNEYALLKKEKGGLDFNDLEKYTLEVLSNKTLLNEIKNKYEYILVDEYQDINEVQEKIITLLSKGDNRFMVGDIKQSIYRFRLCDPSIFLEKYKLYSEKNGGILIRLNSNFRSKKQILDFVNAIFSRTMTEGFGGVNYEKEAKLTPGKDNKESDGKKRVKILFASQSEEAKKTEELGVYSVKEDDQTELSLEKGGEAEGLMIAHEISELVKNKKIYDKNLKRERLIRYSDITILTPSRNACLNRIIETLEKLGIPVSSDAEGDCLEDEYVSGINSFLTIADNYKDDYNLFSAMFSKVFGFSGDELAKIKLAGGGEYFYDCVKAAKGKLSGELKNKLEDFFGLLGEIRAKSKYMSARELAEIVIDKQSVLIKLSFEPGADKRKQKLRKYLSYLKNKNLKEYLGESRDEGMKCEPSHTHGAVKVMTIHRSKGLEFGVVFLVMANKNFNFKSVTGDIVISGDIGLGLNYFDRDARYKTPTISKQAVKLVETRKLLEEQQRLLYVALTRATDYLYVSGYGKLDEIKSEFPVSPKCFMDFMGDLVVHHERYNDVDFDVEIVDADDLSKNMPEPVKRQIIMQGEDASVSKEMKDILFKKYEFEGSVSVPVKTAVTSIVQEQSEEKGFVLFNDDDGSSLLKGTLMHKFMEKITLLEKTNEELEKKKNQLVDEGVFSREDAELIDISGVQKLLSNEEFRSIVSRSQKLFKEKEFYMLVSAKDSFGGHEGDGVVVQGIVDLLAKIDGKLVVVDYKTGRLSDAAISKYKKQVDLYADAMERALKEKVEKRYIASLKTGDLISV